MTLKLIKKIVLTDILFVESMENYVVIHTHVSKEVVYMSLKANQLLIGNHKIPVARNLREEVFRILLEDKLISK